jgi:hypothetical protein
VLLIPVAFRGLVLGLAKDGGRRESTELTPEFLSNQFSDGISAWSITMVSSGPLIGFSSNPS